jgi:hypothetical protein
MRGTTTIPLLLAGSRKPLGLCGTGYALFGRSVARFAASNLPVGVLRARALSG